MSRKEILQASVDELRRHYDAVSSGFGHLRTKALALLVGEFAIIAFLFSPDGSQHFNVNSVYGAVFLGVGVLLLAASLILLLWVTSPSQWGHPPDTKMVRDLKRWFQDDHETFLEYLNADYATTIEVCIARISKRARLLTWAIYTLSIGVFIVTMIKFGGSALHF